MVNDKSMSWSPHVGIRVLSILTSLAALDGSPSGVLLYLLHHVFDAIIVLK